jgi:N-acetylneuraminate synthase
MSANHLGDYNRAEAIVRAAAEAGADAVKLQTYTPDTMTLNLPGQGFEASSKLWQGRRLYDLYREAMTPWEWHEPLKALACSLGIELFSSPFDTSAVDFLAGLNMPAMKVASFELVDHGLVRACADTGLPLIISTGMATEVEISEAVAVARGAGCSALALLKCTSSYPARFEEMNLRTIPDMAMRFGVPVGLSDHSPGSAVPVAAVALGACIIEKHLTLARSDGGPDAAFSLEHIDFKYLVEEGKRAYSSLGHSEWSIQNSEKESRRLRRSLYITDDVKAGDKITVSNLRAIRPGEGCSPKFLQQLLGRKFKEDFQCGTPMDISFAVD